MAVLVEDALVLRLYCAHQSDDTAAATNSAVLAPGIIGKICSLGIGDVTISELTDVMHK